ncbi:MAG: CotH kinase family protein [Thermomicrobiales bacterium]|nr:CotH kinase family protein [Thermomicrobiales bacterium]MCO5220288.1 CotH kinase family protein [Thermomicrobiales bacterium]
MLLSISEPASRLTRRSLLISSASAAALLAMPNRAMPALGAQTPATSTGVFLDPSVLHDVMATFDQDEYDAMIATFAETGDKEWLSATVTIDGQVFEQTGLRLKGNSSLMGLRGDNGGFDFQEAEDFLLPQTVTNAEGTPVAVPGDGTFEPRVEFGGGMGGNVSADEPQGLPWLVRLDRNIDGQNYNGLYEFVIRSNNSETALNEALALNLLTEAGLASQAAAFIHFSTNGSDPRLRIAIENPDDVWLEKHFSLEGTLFKSEAEGNWSYRDENWESYVEAFDLEAGGSDDDAEDYAPLISFLDFLNNSDDAAFTTDLPARLDIEQFAVYMAMMDLIQNDDAIDGPGNNSYLYYDPATSMFTVAPWDMNLAFGGMGGFGGGTGMGPGGNMGGRPQGTPGQGQFPMDGETLMINGTPIAAGDMPMGPESDFIQDGGMGGRGGFGGMSNPLARRWDANTEFATLQSETQDRLRSELFESGTATNILARWVSVLETQATDLVDQSTIDRESQSLQGQIDAA